jgi:hypothetical protein
MRVRDIVTSVNKGNPLLSGKGIYKDAIVISVEPLVLVSKETDMRWDHFPKEDLWVIGKASLFQYFKCLKRKKY